MAMPLPTPEFHHYTITRNKDSDLEFEGTLLSEATSHSPTNTDRWTELRVYQTRAGAYICEEVGCSDLDGEIDRSNAIVADYLADVIGFFGHGWLAKQLYQSANINARTLIA